MTRQTTAKPLVLFVSHGFKNKDLADLIYGNEGIGFFIRRTIKGTLGEGHDPSHLKILDNGSSSANPDEARKMLEGLIAGIDDLDVDSIRYIVGKEEEVEKCMYLLRSVASALVSNRGPLGDRLPVEVISIDDHGAVYWAYEAT